LGLFPIYGKIKIVRNHQPAIVNRDHDDILVYH
jgi:hypothetical protein